MNPEADKLRKEITDADKRIADLEKRPGLTDVIRHQIDKAKDGVRDMRIRLAGMDERADTACRHCGTRVPYSFLFCRACIRELPLKLYALLKGAVGFHHHKLISDTQLQQAIDAASSHLRQHSSAIL